MPTREERLLAAVGTLYDAALDPGLYGAGLEAVGDALGFVGATMHSLTRERTLLAASPRLAEPTVVYQRDWYPLDPMVLAAREKRLGPGTYVDREIVPERTLARGVFYNEFLPQWGLAGMSAAVMAPEPGALISIGLLSAPGRTPDATERRLIALAGDHLARSVMMNAALRTVAAERDSLIGALGRFQAAAALVRRDGAVTAVNDRLLALEGRGLAVRRNRLVAETPGRQGDLDRLVAETADGGLAPRLPPVLVLARTASATPLLLRAVPVTARRVEAAFAGADRAPSALVLAIDPDGAPDDAGPDILRALGLTRAQARIAFLLAMGETPRDIAALLRISPETVRTTIKAAYGRLGVNRQAGLSRLVALVKPLA